MRSRTTLALILLALTACERSSPPPPPAAKPPAPTGTPAPTQPPPPAPTSTPEPAPTGTPAPTGAPVPTGAPAPTGVPAPTAGPAQPQRVETDSGLIIEEISAGTGAEAKKFDHVRVHYRGMLAEGREFANSYTANEPLTASLAGGVIKGWQEGIPGMKVGGKRRLIVPPELGYGKRGMAPNIPGDAMLIFEIELLEIVK